MENGTTSKETVGESGASLWGAEIDRAAASQLGLSDDHIVVMMANQFDYLDDLQDVARQLEEEDCGYCHPQEVLDAVEERMVQVPLPQGMTLVAMAPAGKKEPRSYGLVRLPGYGGEAQ